MATYRKVPTGEITTDDRYQRDLDPARVARIVREFDPHMLGTLEVSERSNGKPGYAVFDGQHRLAALRELGIDTAPCLIHKLSAEDEARLFVRLQTDRKNIHPVDRFRAALFAGDEQATAINGIVEAQGFTILHASALNGIKAVGAVERIYKRDGADHLLLTLGWVSDLWMGDDKATNGYLLDGFAKFLQEYGNRLNGDAEQRLREVSPVVIIRRALGHLQGGGSHARHAICSELHKVSGIKGRPSSKPRAKKAVA